MPTSYTLGEHFGSFVQSQLASGRYHSASEVLRDALRLMEDLQHKLTELDAAIERGMSDINAGRVTDADAVFERLEAKYTRLAEERREQ